jgi:hypothetical protein
MYDPLSASVMAPQVFHTYVSLLTTSIVTLRSPMLKAPPWPTSHIRGPHAVLPHLGTHATWYHIPHLCELVCVLTLACDSNPYDCKALLPQTLSLGTTATAPFQTLGLKKQSSPLGNLALTPTMNASHLSLALWALLATNGPINSVDYFRLYQPLWPYLITLHVGHLFHPTSFCTSLAQRGTAIYLGNPTPLTSDASLTIYVNSNPIVNVFRFILAALFFTARECNSIQLRLSARMLCWLTYNGRTPSDSSQY